MSQILQVLLPKLHLNQNTARSIIFGPEMNGGLALPYLYVTQGTDKLRLFLCHSHGCPDSHRLNIHTASDRLGLILYEF